MAYFKKILNKFPKIPKVHVSSAPVVVVVLFTVFSFVSYRISEQIVKQEANNKLLLFAESKEAQVYDFIEHIKNRAVDFASDEYIRSEVAQFAKTPSVEIQTNLSHYLKQEKLLLDIGFAGIFILNQEGEIIAATDETVIGRDDAQWDHFKMGLMEPFAMTPNPGEPVHFMLELPIMASVPIYEPGTKAVRGVIVLVHKTDELSDVLSGQSAVESGALTQTEGGRSSLEVGLINREGKVVAADESGGEIKILQQIDVGTLPTRECFEHGREFIGETTDFIGEQDLVASMCFPTFGWTLVVQQDIDSAFIAVTYLQRNAFLISGLFLILVVLFLYFYAQTQKKFNEEKDTFLSLASHQLRTPLGAMRWNLESLLAGDAGEIPAPRKEILQEIYKSNGRLIDLMNNLLEITRINQGRKRFTFTLQNPNDVIKEAVKAITPLARVKDINISTQLANNAPAMLLEEKHFSEVITNFLSNAIKYSQDGGTIYISTSTEGNKLRIAIRDAGIGIPAADQKNIFSKFYRASNAPLKSPTGEGLGLYLVKTFVGLWGGKVWFESIEGEGSTFYVQLPIKN